MKRLAFYATALLALAACNKAIDTIAPDEAEVLSADAREICFNVAESGVEAAVETKATTAINSGNFSTQVTSVYWMGKFGSTSLCSPTSFSVVPSGIKTSYYWPATSQPCEMTVSNVSFSNAGVISVANTNTDIICTQESVAYQQTGNLVMDHIFARLGEVSVTATNDYVLSNVTVTWTPLTSGSYTIGQGTWSSTAGGSVETPINNVSPNASTVSTSNYDCWMVPSFYTFTVTATISKGGFSKTISAAAVQNVNLDTAGKIHKVNFNIKGEGAQEITFTVGVSDWTTGDVVNYDVPNA